MLGGQRPFSPSVPAEAGCLFAVAAGVHVFISVEIGVHCMCVQNVKLLCHKMTSASNMYAANPG